MSTQISRGAVIIATRGRPRMLADTLDSVAAGDALPAEVVVVDQSDVPDEGLRARKLPAGCRLRYVWTDARGLSRANNRGIAETDQDVLVFTHDDVRVREDWFRRIVAALDAAGPGDVITGRVLPEPGPVGTFVPSTKSSEVPEVFAGRVAGDPLYPMNMAARRAVLEAVGGFDTRLGPGTPFPAAEDNDLGHRLLAAGHRIVYDPGVVVAHRAWRPLSERRHLYHGYGRGQGAFYAKHLLARDPHILSRIGSDLRRSAKGAVRTALDGAPSDRVQLPYLGGVAIGMAGWIVRGRSTPR